MSQKILFQHRSDEIAMWGGNGDGKSHLEFITPHIHREMELVFYDAGKTIAYADSERYDLQAGDVFLTFPNQIHSYETYENETFRIYQIKPELIPELLDVFEMAVPSSAVIHGAARDPRIRALNDSLAAALKQLPESYPYRAHLVHGYLLALFSELLAKMKLNGMHLTDSDAMRAIVSYCTRNYDKELSLATLEEELHLNKYYISHLFSGKLKMRFNDYVNSLRISEACKRLIHSDESITDISNSVGFNTLRTFNRAFLKQIGMTPSEYRKSDPRTAGSRREVGGDARELS